MFLLFRILCALVFVLHIGFAVLEMVFWKSKAPQLFGVTPEFARASAALASNQGLYNGFIAASLLLGMIVQDVAVGHAFLLYGLGCALIAGLWGAITVSRRIFFIQALPALVALCCFPFLT